VWHVADDGASALRLGVSIANRVMSSMGWGSCELPELAGVAGGVKSQPNAGSPHLSRGRLT